MKWIGGAVADRRAEDLVRLARDGHDVADMDLHQACVSSLREAAVPIAQDLARDGIALQPLRSLLISSAA